MKSFLNDLTSHRLSCSNTTSLATSIVVFRSIFFSMKYFRGRSTDTYCTEPHWSTSNMQKPSAEKCLTRAQANRYVSDTLMCLCSAVFNTPCTLACRRTMCLVYQPCVLLVLCANSSCEHLCMEYEVSSYSYA